MKNDILKSFSESDIWKKLDTDTRTMIETYLSLLFKFNKTIKLTSFKDMNTWVTTQIEDCILAYSYLSEYSDHCFIDCGSGNGLPGIIFKILEPKLNITLLDIDKRKAEFLKTVIFRLKLSQIDVENTDLLQFEAKVPRRTLFTYRAFSPQSIQFKNIQKMHDSKHVVFSSKDIKNELKSFSAIKYNLSNEEERNLLISP